MTITTNGNGKARTYAMGVWTILGPIVLTLFILASSGYLSDLRADVEKKADKAVVIEQVKRLDQKLDLIILLLKNGG